MADATVYGVGGKLLKTVQSFYIDSRVCVHVGNDVSEWFTVKGIAPLKTRFVYY